MYIQKPSPVIDDRTTVATTEMQHLVTNDDRTALISAVNYNSTVLYEQIMTMRPDRVVSAVKTIADYRFEEIIPTQNNYGVNINKSRAWVLLTARGRVINNFRRGML